MMVSKKEILNVEGLSCMHCVNSVKQAVSAINGVSQVEVDLTGKKVTVVYENVKLDAIIDAIENAGYEVV